MIPHPHQKGAAIRKCVFGVGGGGVVANFFCYYLPLLKISLSHCAPLHPPTNRTSGGCPLLNALPNPRNAFNYNNNRHQLPILSSFPNLRLFFPLLILHPSPCQQHHLLISPPSGYLRHAGPKKSHLP